MTDGRISNGGRALLCFAMMLALLVSLGGTTYAATVTVAPDTVVGGATATGTVTLDAPAAATGVVVTLASNNASATVPASITVPAGQSTGTFPITTLASPKQILATITATINGAASTTSLTINPIGLTSVAANPTGLVGGVSAQGTVTLTGPAPEKGTKVSLSSSSGAVGVPGSILVPAGQASVTFNISTKKVAAKTEATITASLGYVATTATMTVEPEGPASISLNSPSVKGAAQSTGTVTLTGAAPNVGLTVALTSNNKVAAVPNFVNIPAGTNSATFTINTVKVSAQVVVTITAKFGAQVQSTTLTVTPPGVASIVLNPTTVVGSSPSGATLTLTEPAPLGGITIALASDQPAATLPPTIVIPAGKTIASFTIRTVGVAAQTVANIKATISGVAQSSPLTITPPGLVSIVLGTPSLDGGNSSEATVNISSPAPPGGLVIAVASSNKSAIVPAKISVPAGKTSVAFSIRTTKVDAQATATITATLGAINQTATLTIN